MTQRLENSLHIIGRSRNEVKMINSIIDNMPYKHVSNMYTRTLINAYSMLLYAMQHNPSIDDVVAWIKAYIGCCDKAIDVFYSIDDIDMVDYMLFTTIHLDIFADLLGGFNHSRDFENIRFHYSIDV